MDVNQSQPSTVTRPSLLLRVRDVRDKAAWLEFVDVYGPLIYAYARRRGLQDADAADLTQEVLISVAASIDKFDYDAARGRFRGWLFTTTRNQIINAAAKAKRTTPGAGNTEIAEILTQYPDPNEPDDEFQRRFDWQMFLTAAKQVRSHFSAKTWQAFWWNVIEGRSATDVAQRSGMSVGAVYIAKSRVLNAVRTRLPQLEEL